GKESSLAEAGTRHLADVPVSEPPSPGPRRPSAPSRRWRGDGYLPGARSHGAPGARSVRRRGSPHDRMRRSLDRPGGYPRHAERGPREHAPSPRHPGRHARLQRRSDARGRGQVRPRRRHPGCRREPGRAHGRPAALGAVPHIPSGLPRDDRRRRGGGPRRKTELPYRGYTLDAMTAMTLEEIIELLPARPRRSFMRGIDEERLTFVEKVRENGTEEAVRTHCRDVPILPDFVGKKVAVHNGKEFVTVEIRAEMIGHYIGEFAMTRKPVTHSGPGVGATRS